MKKTYIKPEMETEVLILDNMMISASTDTISIDFDTEANEDYGVGSKELNTGDWGSLW